MWRNEHCGNEGGHRKVGAPTLFCGSRSLECRTGRVNNRWDVGRNGRNCVANCRRNGFRDGDSSAGDYGPKKMIGVGSTCVRQPRWISEGSKKEIRPIL